MGGGAGGVFNARRITEVEFRTMLQRPGICALAVALVVFCLSAPARSAGRGTDAVLAADELSAASSRTTKQTAPASSRTLRTSPASSRPLGGTVGPDNYQYFHQACCL